MTLSSKDMLWLSFYRLDTRYLPSIANPGHPNIGIDWGSESSIQNRIAAIVRNYFKLYEIKLVSHLAAIPSTVIV